MAQLRLSYPKFQAKGAEILQISYNTPEEARLYFQRYNLLFPYLCDPDWAVYQLYGLSTVTCTLGDVFKRFTDGTLEFFRTREIGPSPLPVIRRHGLTETEQAVLVVDKAGIVRYLHRSGPIDPIPSSEQILQTFDTL